MAPRESTLSVRRGPGSVRAPARLVMATEADRPREPSTGHVLGSVDEVVVARGAERRAVRDRAGGVRRLTLELPDRRLSSVHARIRRVLGAWVVEDAGSKNGVLINGEPCTKRALADGDVIEMGHSFLVFVADTPVDNPMEEAADGPPAAVRAELATFCPRLARQFDAVSRVAASAVSLLLVGESGTGKEVVAHALHDASGRRGPFVAVNCGALPESLVEAQLFGHRKGAFSGAVEDRPGLVRAADGGTLMLDEIGDLPAASQAALLRVLQEREVTPIGETRPIPVDLRLVAATHRDLDARVEAGTFRGDLLARLTGLTVELPPLRARRQDLGLILASLLRRLAGATPVVFTPAALRQLFCHGWPGNVRELEKVLGAALALAGGDDGAIEIDVMHLPPALRAIGDDASVEGASDQRRRAELDSRLRAARGNVSEVARAMGTTRMQIHRWAKRLGIDLGQYR